MHYLFSLNVLIFTILLLATQALCNPLSKTPESYALQENIESNQNQISDYQEYLFPNEENNGGIRQARVTCDVLSFQSKILSINHSACAVRCIAQKKKGGSCKDGVCVCRN